jgi:hypothetical protein
MINNLIGKGNVNEQLTHSVYYFTHVLMNTNKDWLRYCQIILFWVKLMATFAEHRKILKQIEAFKPQLEKAS